MIVKGYASTVDIDSDGHVVLPSAYSESIRKRGLRSGKGVKLLHAHDSRLVVGGISVLEVRNRGLWLEAHIDEKISYGKDLAQAIRASGGLSFSVGFFPIDAEIVKDHKKGTHLLVTKVDIVEVSVVTFPANDEALIVSYYEDGAADDTVQNISNKLSELKRIMAV
nr:HK97 family phage prohead protease [uncultured Cohaesibacter sp.]